MCLVKSCKEARAEAQGSFGHMHELVRSFIHLGISLACVDWTILATQTGQSSAGISENGCQSKRREEAESFSKKPVKVTGVAWQAQATTHATLHATLHAELPKCWQGRHFGTLSGSVACSVVCNVACSVAWVSRVVCSVACGGCHVPQFASCSTTQYEEHKSNLIIVPSNNTKLGSRGFKRRPLKVVQDFFRPLVVVLVVLVVLVE